MNLIEELKNNLNNSKLYLFQNLETTGFCYKVIDGDTIKCIIKWKEEYLKLIVRLDNVDTAEKKSKIESERKLALQATEFTKRLLENKPVYLIFKEADKYGRHLCNVYLNTKIEQYINISKDLNEEISTNDYTKEEIEKLGASVSEQLIENNLALEYDGGKKKDFSKLISDTI